MEAAFGLPPGFREAVAARLAAAGWQADQLLLLASHSHTSLDLTALNPKNSRALACLYLAS